MDSVFIIILAAVCAALITFISTPLVRVFAYKINALDIPQDDRRMHKDTVPRLGGLAIFAGFIIATAAFCEISPTLITIWVGGLFIVAVGIVDDIKPVHFAAKFAVEICAALIAAVFGQTITFINFFGTYITLGAFEIPVTVLWIVALTNAINLIDGLDGLSCGISSICSLSLMICSIILLDSHEITLICAILAASCIGFLPFNSNPAKIFMGDTGALFLGYTLSLLSINGLFKTHAALSVLLPISIFGLPLFDTVFAFFRRIANGKSPFEGDRGHIHHKLIDAGFNVKQSVFILYAVSALLGLSAVLFTSEAWWKAGIIVIAGLGLFILNFICIKNAKTKYLTSIFKNGEAVIKSDKNETDEEKK